MEGYQPDFWHWWILGLGLIIVEVLVPGTFFLWMGVAALVVGFVTWLVPALAWEYQLMLFAILSLVSIVGWRVWQRKHPDESDQPTLNRRAEQYIGRVFMLDTPIENGFGKVLIGLSGGIDSALTAVNGLRGNLGAIQNRFESTIVNLQTVSENLAASRGRIQDADFAAETAALTKAQILQQAGVAVLSQANAQPQRFSLHFSEPLPRPFQAIT